MHMHVYIYEYVCMHVCITFRQLAFQYKILYSVIVPVIGAVWCCVMYAVQVINEG